MKYIYMRGKHADRYAVVSNEDYPVLSKYKWYLHKGGYAYTGDTYMHHLIRPVIKGLEVEHKDGNRLNNQRSNLRYATRTQNHANRHTKPPGSSSRYKGVSLRKDAYRNKPWRAGIWKDYKQYRLGSFATETEAALAYNQAAVRLFGKFAALNEV